MGSKLPRPRRVSLGGFGGSGGLGLGGGGFGAARAAMRAADKPLTRSWADCCMVVLMCWLCAEIGQVLGTWFGKIRIR